MELIFLLLIFIIGTLFGSFATLAVYRLPLKKDIIKERSFCPNCGHKLGFFDLIPILSYVFLGGKCRYCKEKIRPRYFIIEVLSGFIAVLLYLKLQIPVMEVTIDVLFNFLYLIIYATTIMIIAGIDREKKIVFRPVILFGTLLCLGYMLYLCIVGQLEFANMYRYIIYIASILILYFINNIKCDNHIIDLVMIIEYMQLFITTNEVFMTVLIMILITVMKIASIKLKPIDKSNILSEEENEKGEIPIAFYLAISNLIVVCIQVFKILVL